MNLMNVNKSKIFYKTENKTDMQRIWCNFISFQVLDPNKISRHEIADRFLKRQKLRETGKWEII